MTVPRLAIGLARLPVGGSSIGRVRCVLPVRLAVQRRRARDRGLHVSHSTPLLLSRALSRCAA